MKYGHRNNVEGYASALREFDEGLAVLMEHLADDDLLILTADHGCDPTTVSTDHSREYVPILAYGRHIKKDVDIGTRASFADIGATAAHVLGLKGCRCGESFINLIIK
jgi:phosphopentomutase